MQLVYEVEHSTPNPRLSEDIYLVVALRGIDYCQALVIFSDIQHGDTFE